MSDSNQKPKYKRRCDGLREDLKTCLLYSDCVRVFKKTPKHCLGARGELYYPEECWGLHQQLCECKRSMFDMRQRFRLKKGY